MPLVRVLFDMTQLSDPVPARAFFRSLLSAIEPRMMAGCSLYHGFADQAGMYCIAIYSDDAMLANALARAAMSVNWALPSPPQVIVDQVPRMERLALAAKVNSQGLLDDVRFEALPEIWRTAQMGYMNARRPAPEAPAQPLYARDPTPPGVGSIYGRVAPPTAPLPSNLYEPSPVQAAPTHAQSLRRHPGFPRSAPAVLQTPVSRHRALAAVIGILLGALAAIAVFELTPKNTLLFQMFDLRQPMTVITVAVLMMFFWGCGLCFFRWRRLAAMEAISDPGLLKQAIALLEGFGIHGLRADLEEPSAAFSPLLRRMRAVVHQWSLHPGLQDTDVLMQQLADSDDEAIHNGYSLARTFVWALPVLGLIGTVIGISAAVGGFARFLGGSIDDVNIIKENLVNVTGGLSFAFLITLEGLLTSLLLMLAASWLQTRERELCAGVQEDVAAQLIPALQRVAPDAAKTPQKGVDLSGVREVLVEQSSAAASQIAAAGERLLNMMAAKNDQWMEKLTAVGAELMESSRASSAERQQQAERAFSSTANLQHALLDKITQQAETVAKAAEAVRSLGDTTGRILECQRDLRQAIGELDGAPARAAFEGFSEALRAGSAEMARVMQSAEALARLSHQIVSAQASLQQATQQLADSQFGETLRELRQSMISLAPVLSSFQKPFVLQAVPFARDGST